MIVHLHLHLDSSVFQANTILPHSHSHHLHCLPTLINMAASFDITQEKRLWVQQCKHTLNNPQACVQQHSLLVFASESCFLQACQCSREPPEAIPRKETTWPQTLQSLPGSHPAQDVPLQSQERPAPASAQGHLYYKGTHTISLLCLLNVNRPVK